MSSVIRKVIMHFLQNSNFWKHWIVIRILFIGNMDQYVDLRFHGVIFWKIHAWYYCFWWNVKKACLKLKLLPISNVIVNYKELEFRLQVFYKDSWYSFFQVYLEDFLFLAFICPPHHLITYALLGNGHSGLILFWTKW
jgi:hypothetical protein